MARVLLTWELGGGLGHLMRLLPLASGLRQRGHRVCLALRNPLRAQQVFAGLDVSYLQAPIRTRKTLPMFTPPRTFAQILHNNAFGDFEELLAMTNAWHNLYDSVRPDLIVFDHSPIALLAARGCHARRAVTGTGFCCPLDQCPMPDLRPWLPENAAGLKNDEDFVLANANRVLRCFGQEPLKRISQLYYQVDESFLATFRELDHYPGRQSARYWGAWPNVGGKRPVWPRGEGKRIFAYLKPFPALPGLLSRLHELRHPTIVYAEKIDENLQHRFQSASLRFEREPLDLKEIGKSCDLAILNGTHGTTVSMLLAGVPILQLPIFLEQGMLGAAIERLGAGLCGNASNPQQVEKPLTALLNSSRYSQAARRFAARYASFSPESQIDEMVDRASELLN